MPRAREDAEAAERRVADDAIMVSSPLQRFY
jgi:hypothetical protein